MKTIRVGSRESRLAVVQSELVMDAIRAIRLIVATMANAVQEGRQGEANTEAAPAAEAAAE